MSFAFSTWLKDTKRERERAEKIKIRSLCTVADCTDKPFAGRVHSLCIQSSTWINPRPAFKRSCMPYMHHKRINTQTVQSALFTNSFCSTEFLKNGCRLARNWVFCHYCVCSIESQFLFSAGYFLILSLFTGLLKVPGWFGPCHTRAAPRSLHPHVQHLVWLFIFLSLGAHSLVTTLSSMSVKRPSYFVSLWGPRQAAVARHAKWLSCPSVCTTGGVQSIIRDYQRATER